jgi:hypothetical protein
METILSIIIVVLFIISAWVASELMILKFRNKTLEIENKELQMDVEALCVLNTLPIIGNFEDIEYPSEERMNEMLDDILMETKIKK